MLLPYLNSGILEAGCDEAGRGCLAGPVIAAAVILPEKFFHPLLNDSKKMTEADREKLAPLLKTEAIAWAIGIVSAGEIDQINILNASFKAMSLAVTHLQIKPNHLLIDGNRFKSSLNIPYTCVVKGDGKYNSIAAASVLAKTYRDELMRDLGQSFLAYNWAQNKGYPTIAHRKAIAEKGVTIHHRKSFQLLPSQMNLFENEPIK